VLTLFRSNQLFASILLVFYIALLRGSAFVIPVEAEPLGAGIFSELVYQWIGEDGQQGSIAAMVLLLLQGFYLNVIVAEHRLAPKVSLFPGLFYVFMCSLLPAFHYLSPVLMANTFFMVVLGEIYGTYKRSKVAGRIFNIGFWTGVGSLFYPSFALLLLFGFAGLGTFRPFRIRERLMVIIGSLVPYFLLGTYYFWHDQLPWFIETVRSGFEFLGFIPTAAPLVYRSLGIMAVVLLVVLFSHRSYLLKQGMDVQRKINVIYWGLFVSAATILVQSGVQLDHWLVVAMPVGILLSFNFIRMPARMAEVIHLLMLVVALGLQFLPMLFPPG
jgi:hypothetical protein